ncbi:MAG: hypothetical protein KA715_01000 [Xanthomonadaceae bacterium]|nr:hypothetical protein [Xanthomonadaceae bacterium]
MLVFSLSSAHATSLHSISAGYENFNPLGSSAQKYTNPIGANLTAFVDSDFFKGNYQAVISGQFLLLPLKSAPAGMNLMGFAGYVGLRTHPDLIKQSSWFSPTFAILFGGMYTTLALPSTAISTTTNAGIVFAAQVVPGFEFTVWRQFGLSLTFPVTLLYGTASMVLANQVVSVRYEL